MNLHARRKPAVVSSLAILAALVASATPAFAGDVLAETLYQEGRRAAQAHDWNLACKKYRESQEREPAPGTLLNLADCEEKRGELMAALAHFDAAAALFQDDRAGFAKQRAVALESRLPKLTLRLAPNAPVGTTVERDGHAVEGASFGLPVPLDPGEHSLVVKAPGRVDVKVAVQVREAESKELVLAPGDGSASPSSAPPAADPGVLGGHSRSPASSGSNARRTAGFIGLGVGALGLGAGIVGTLMIGSAKTDADANCRQEGCTDDGLAAQSRGKTANVIATGGMVMAALGVATGGVLLFVVPALGKTRASGLAAIPVPGGSMMGVRGDF